MYVFYNFYKRVFNSIQHMVRSEWLYFIFISLLLFFLFFEQISIAFPSLISSALLQDQRIQKSVLHWEMSVCSHKWIFFFHALEVQTTQSKQIALKEYSRLKTRNGVLEISGNLLFVMCRKVMGIDTIYSTFIQQGCITLFKSDLQKFQD